MRLTIAYSKIKKQNLVLIKKDTHQRETLSERPIRQPLKVDVRESFKGKKATVFALFKSTFLRNLSLSNARRFWGEQLKILKGNLYLTENRLSKNEMWCASETHNNMRHICAKELLDLNFNLAVIYKYQFLVKLPQISHIHKNQYMFKYDWIFFRLTASFL